MEPLDSSEQGGGFTGRGYTQQLSFGPRTDPRVDLTWDHSPTLGALFGALAKAQGKIKGAAKDSENPFLKSKYADLSSVWEACRGPLAENALCVIQIPEAPERVDPGIYATRAVVRTVLGHESGEWLAGRMSLPVLGMERKGGGRDEVSAQSFGVGISYARRYSLAAVVGVYQDDEDGEIGVIDAPPSMSELEITEHLEAIRESANADSLKAAWLAAYKAAGRDQVAGKKLLDAKDARKAQLALFPK